MKLKVLSLLILLIIIPTNSNAQATSLDPNLIWQDHRKLADAISILGPITAITLDTIHSLRSSDRKRALIRESIKDGILIGIAEGTKHIIHRERPDNSDNKSFFSEHTELSASLFGSNKSLSVILTFNTAALRTASGKHYLTDVVAGALIGSGISELMK